MRKALRATKQSLQAVYNFSSYTAQPLFYCFLLEFSDLTSIELVYVITALVTFCHYVFHTGIYAFLYFNCSAVLCGSLCHFLLSYFVCMYVDKYRPTKVSEMILTSQVKKLITEIKKKKTVPTVKSWREIIFTSYDTYSL